MAHRPEILAPAGDAASLAAALAAGADAVYFGLDDGFNARARAENFSLANLAETVERIHRGGARAYLTLNTLVFESELATLEEILRRVAAAGIDALIVQDPAVALMARAICPELELHASTQMTVSSAEGLRFAAGLGIRRVVVPRELSVAEIGRLAASTELELEVFIHGALCVSWSGQCLTSEAWGGRSANRGQCAQSCRMPYDLVVDGVARELGDVKYLLSPRDLAGVDAVPELVAIGVHGLKIEGRQKGPEYVASAVAGYREWLDGVVAGHADRTALAERLTAMALTYSRGFSPGFLAGPDHQSLVEGRFPKHRGVYAGRVITVENSAVVIESDEDGSLLAPAIEPRAGMGVVFDDGAPESDEAGGPIFRVERAARGFRLGFGRPGPELARVRIGQRVWITSDPARRIPLATSMGRRAIRLTVSGALGAPLRVVTGAIAITSDAPLAAAHGRGLNAALLADKLGGFGGTAYHLEALDADSLPPDLHLPVSELKAMRRRLVIALDAAWAPHRTIATASVLPGLRARLRTAEVPEAAPRLLALCRTDAQLDAVIAAGLPEVELDWMELVGLGRAVARARAAGLAVTIATVRVQKPGEEGFDTRLGRLTPDAVLVRHWGALMHFLSAPAGERRPALHGDFSLNVTNGLTAGHLFGLGLETLTCAHDLDAVQLFALLEQAPVGRLTVAVHHHVPTFHTEHCVYSHLLSEGRDYRSCGRPCESQEVALRDRVGLVHPVVVDVGCRNTVFNAKAQTAAALVPRLLERGVRRFRVELVRESAAETTRVLEAYRELLAGRISPTEAVRRVGVHEQFGVTRGTMKVLG